MLQSALWFYKQWRTNLEGNGFTVNPYDLCVANKMVNGKQLTVIWHVDDAKISHEDPAVVTEFVQWTDRLYGDDELGRVKAVRGHRHDYLGMILNYEEPGVVSIDMDHYVSKMLEDYEYPIKERVTSPANHALFQEYKTAKKLNEKERKHFHTMVAKALFLCKRARPDILPTTTYLCSRVKEPNVVDKAKLHRMMAYLKLNPTDKLRLEACNYVVTSADAAFAVHDDYKSHTGVTVSLGRGTIHAESKKQKLNTRSSTEAELVAADEAMTNALWTKWFCEQQGYPVTSNRLKQDNQAAMKLEENGKFSSHKRTRHINIRYFFITDQVDKKNVSIEYCPTDKLEADFMSKPLQGAKFQQFKNVIMNTKKKCVSAQ